MLASINFYFVIEILIIDILYWYTHKIHEEGDLIFSWNLNDIFLKFKWVISWVCLKLNASICCILYLWHNFFLKNVFQFVQPGNQNSRFQHFLHCLLEISNIQHDSLSLQIKIGYPGKIFGKKFNPVDSSNFKICFQTLMNFSKPIR